MSVRYYFDVAQDGDRLVDLYGSECESLGEAQELAVAVAKQIMVDNRIDIEGSPIAHTISVTLRNEHDRIRYVITFTLMEVEGPSSDDDSVGSDGTHRQTP